jgi:hypothetical protein
MVCPREEVLCSIHSVIRKDIVDGDGGVNFEQGHAVHWMFQSKILAKAGVMIGSWRCTYCGTQYGARKQGYIPRPHRCVRCGATAEEAGRSNGRPDESINGNAFVYVEEWVGNYEHKIGGSPDGYMIQEYRSDYEMTDLTLLEFKSCNELNFNKYKEAPDFVHIIQAQLYMWLTGCRKAKAIYFNKNGVGTKGIAEHDFDYDPECIERVTDAVKEIRTGILNNEVPPRVVCMTSDCPRAMRCHVQDKCFSGE